MPHCPPYRTNDPLRTRDVAKWIYRNKPDQFTPRDVADALGIRGVEAKRCVRQLVARDLATPMGYVSGRDGKRPGVEYCLTQGGVKYAKEEIARRGGRR